MKLCACAWMGNGGKIRRRGSGRHETLIERGGPGVDINEK